MPSVRRVRQIPKTSPKLAHRWQLAWTAQRVITDVIERRRYIHTVRNTHIGIGLARSPTPFINRVAPPLQPFLCVHCIAVPMTPTPQMKVHILTFRTRTFRTNITRYPPRVLLIPALPPCATNALYLPIATLLASLEYIQRHNPECDIILTVQLDRRRREKPEGPRGPIGRDWQLGGDSIPARHRTLRRGTACSETASPTLILLRARNRGHY